jgi:superfamily I DNA/RNA helicase
LALQLLLRRYADRLDRRRDFRLLTPRESRQALRLVAERSHLSVRQMADCATVISGEKNGADLRTLAQEVARSGGGAAGRGPVRCSTERVNAPDLDDLLALTVRLLRSDRRVRDACRTTLQELIVDEYQDTNPRQQQLLELLCPHSGSVVAVGDEDQAIYGWRQAGTGGVEAFRRMFPACETVTLGLSYRHSKLILRSAAALIEHNKGRTPRPCAPIICRAEAHVLRRG